MNWYIIAGLGVAGAVISGLAIYNWKMIFRIGKQTGEAQEQAETSAAASKVQTQMGEAMAQTRTADELVDKWRKGGSL
jgi:hypothetical protein